MKVYLAGPDVFEPDAIAIGAAKKALCEKHGFIGVFPLDNEMPDFSHSRETGLRIGTANEALMDTCDLIIANMQPWHGPSMDVGTAYEMGYMRAQKKPVFGYSPDLRPISEKVAEHFSADLRTGEAGELIDPLGKHVENFGGLTDNLMMVNAIIESGSEVQPNLESALIIAKKTLL